MVAMRAAIDAFSGAAEEAGVGSEEDVAALVRAARAGMWAGRAAGAPA